MLLLVTFGGNTERDDLDLVVGDIDLEPKQKKAAIHSFELYSGIYS